MRFVLPVLLGVSLLAGGDFRYQRRYKDGEVERYQMRARFEGEAREETATSEHRTEKRGKHFVEVVRWAGESFVQTLSLDPRAEMPLAIPKDNVALTGMVTDLHTFYLVLRPDGGIDRLRKKGDEFAPPEPMLGEWSDGVETLLGQSRTKLRSKLVDVVNDYAVIQSTFSQPDDRPLAMRRPWMNEPVCGKPNNFKLIRKQGNGYVVIWGCEEFDVTMTVERRRGRINEAKMDNKLHWKLRFCRDLELTNCQPLPDMKRRRIVELRRDGILKQ